MAVVNLLGVNVTKFESPGNDNWIDQGKIKSSLKVWSDTVETGAADSDTSTYHLATLPAGAVIHGIQCAWDDIGDTTSDLHIGDSDDPDRYQSANDVSSAGSNDVCLIGGRGYVIGTNAGDTEILATVDTADLNAAGTISLTVFYA